MSLAVLAALLLAYLVSSGLYLRSFRLRRTPDTILISASGAFKAEAQRLVKAFAGERGQALYWWTHTRGTIDGATGWRADRLPGR